MAKIFMREEYLNKIRGFYDSDIIKVVTGIRRCGKSYLLFNIFDRYLSCWFGVEECAYKFSSARSDAFNEESNVEWIDGCEFGVSDFDIVYTDTIKIIG